MIPFITRLLQHFLKNLRKSARLFVALFCCIGLWGCAYNTSLPLDMIPDRSASIVPGQTDGEAVRAALGTLLITSRSWGIDLFRDASSQKQAPAAILVPFAFIKDDIFRYTLVSYGNGGLAESTATGIYRKPSDWRAAFPIESNYLSLHLQAGDFLFVVEQEDRQETLLAGGAHRDTYLERACHSPQCLAVVGRGTHGCSESLQVDGGEPIPLPCRLRQYDALTALSLQPGSHTLKASGGLWQREDRSGTLSGEKSISFSCDKGEIVYLVIDVSAQKYTRRDSKGVEWKIDLQKEMPDLFRERPLLLYRTGRWFVDPEWEDR